MDQQDEMEAAKKPGLVDQEMAEPAANEPPSDDAPAKETAEDDAALEDSTAEGPDAANELTPQAVRASVKMPPELQDAYDRVVLAGMKVMFSDETHESAMKFLMDDSRPTAQRLGEGITSLMGMLYKESNNTLPPQVIIPAAVELLVAAADYLKKSQAMPVTDKEIGDAMGVMLQTLLAKFGAGPDQITEMMSQFEQTGAQPGQQPGLARSAMQEPGNV